MKSRFVPYPRYGRIIMLILLLFSFFGMVGTATAVDLTITPSNPQGWFSFLESGSNGSSSFVAGPGTPPAGTGSFRMTVGDAATGVTLLAPLYSNTFLASFQTLTYGSYIANNSGSQAISLQLNVDYNILDGNQGWQGRLVYEPSNQGPAPAVGVWQTWDALNSGNAIWWATGAPGNATCPQSSPCTWNTLLAAFPNAGIHPTLPAVIFKAGSGWATFDGNVDLLTVDVGAGIDTYDFEQDLPVHNITQATDHATIQLGIDNATAGDVLTIDPGSYAENVVVDKSLTLRGAGAGTDTAVHTIIEGATLSGQGITINGAITNVTIEDLRVQNFANSGIFGAGNNHHFTAQNVQVHDNGSVVGNAGLYLNGPVDSVLIDTVTASDNNGRGIVIWNGLKTNITITNSQAINNGCCGIELQDGTASGVTVFGNTAVNNGDSGLSAIGLTAGAGPNVIANNTVTDNGRFGIEIKNPNGTGLDSGDGSIVVENNNVSFTASGGMNNRDHAGIAVFRRSFITGNPTGYVDVPTGVIVRNNTVNGYTHLNQIAPPTESEGFGIVIEGINHSVTGNTVQNSGIGIQEQGGLHPNANYVPNNAGDGDQAAGQSTAYFGRGNAPIACANTFSGNTFSGNGQNSRTQVVGNGSGTVTNANTSETFCSIQSAIDDTDTSDGDTLTLTAASYSENVTVSKNITLTGASALTTILTPAANTGNTGDARGWYLVNPGQVFNLSNVTMDGSGFLVYQAIRNRGEGSVDNVVFNEIKYQESGPSYAGTAVAAFGSGPVHVTNSTFTEIGRIGLLYFGAVVNGSLFEGNSYTGKGSGDWLDYALDISAGAVVTVSNNTISGNRGVASSDGSTSACVLVSTFFGAGTNATLINNDLSDCTSGVALGAAVSDSSTLLAKGNSIDNVDNIFSMVGSGLNLTAYANNFTNFTDGGLTGGAGGTFNARHNWWGSYASQPTGVANDSWDYRLGAAVASWGDGTLGTASLTAVGGSGSGSGVIVSHGRGLANVPFGKGVDPYASNMCSDYYDYFVLNAAGNWTVSVPVDNIASCDPTLNTNMALYEFALSGTTPNTTCSGSACWAVPAGISTNGLLLETTLDAATDLLGTPFVAGDNTPDSHDPTAVTLVTFNTSLANPSNWLLIAVFLLLAGLTITVTLLKRKQMP